MIPCKVGFNHARVEGDSAQFGLIALMQLLTKQNIALILHY